MHRPDSWHHAKHSSVANTAVHFQACLANQVIVFHNEIVEKARWVVAPVFFFFAPVVFRIEPAPMIDSSSHWFPSRKRV